MAIFKENAKASTTVKVLSRCIPTIIINIDALTKMQLFVENCADEVGWLGTAYKDPHQNIITIDDVFLFDQEVHATTTEITPEGLGNFGEAILQQEDGIEIWNNLKVWGHSHVNMGVTPSGQDDHQMETFADGGHDWFIRIIANKRGDLRVCVYNYALGVIYNDLPWEESICREELEIEKQIMQLEKLLDVYRKNRIGKFETDIKKEIDAKVKKKSYTQYSINPNNTTNATLGKNTLTNMKTTMKDMDMIGGKKKEEEKKVVIKADDIDDNDLIKDEDDALQWLPLEALVEIGQCISDDAVVDVLEEYNYIGFFKQEEVMIIWKAGRNVCANVYAREIK